MYLPKGYRLHNEKYHLLNVLGEGGFSLTYRGAWKTEVRGQLGTAPVYVPVCIKEYFFKDYCMRNTKTNFVEPNNEAGKEFFDRHKEKIIKEARILAEISHPNVVNVLEVFKQNNTVYIVMEFISGNSLKKELEVNGVFEEKRLLKIIYKIGQALDYIHGKNILHLDVKPSNILIDHSGNPKLIDFGISKKYDIDSDMETSTTLQAASKGYASIEQYDSEAMQVFSPKPDIYSLGATMYFLLTGMVPTESILRSTKGLQNPSDLNPDISPNTERVILKSMALSAENRYSTINEMLIDLGFNPATDAIDKSSILEGESSKNELINKMKEQPYDVDIEDETVINPLTANRNKKKWYFVAASAAAVAGLIGYSIYSQIDKNKNIATTFVPPTEEFIPEDEGADENNALTPDKNGEITKNSPQTASAQPQTEPSEPLQLSEEEINEENYGKTFMKALATFNSGQYADASKLFQSAAKYKNTSEVQNYILLCKQELDKIEIEKRKNLYETFKNFGNFVVVRRKSDGKWGAIDDKGFEIIPCVYAHTELYGDNRIFQKSDNLFDLYSPQGEKIKSDFSGFE